MFWQLARSRLDLRTPRVMGIVNCTPDSFSGGSGSPSDAVALCEAHVAAGADLLDLGAESTRPGAPPVDEADQWRRLEPVLRAALGLGCPVSVDTSEPGVMQRALELGADAVNDVRALRRPGALAVLARHGAAGVCLMHMRGEPATMQQQARYGDVVADVRDFLAARMAEAVAAGIAPERIVLDPGIGFAKAADHSLALLARQAELAALGRPLLVGWSRKSALGAVTGRAVHERLAASVAAAVLAVDRGAAILRVHDVAATVDALRVWRAATSPRPGGPQDAGGAAPGETIPV